MDNQTKEENIVQLPKFKKQGSTLMGHIFDNWEGPDKIYVDGGGNRWKPVVDENDVFQSLESVNL